MGMPVAEAVPAAIDENQVTARLQRVEISSLLAQSEGVAELDGEPFGADVSDGVPIELGAPVPGPPLAPPRRWRWVARAALLVATAVAAYAGYSALLQQGQP